MSDAPLSRAFKGFLTDLPLRALCVQASAGDVDAFEQVVRAAWPDVDGVLNLVIGPGAGAAIADETMVALWANRKQLASPDKMPGFILGLARKVADQNGFTPTSLSFAATTPASASNGEAAQAAAGGATTADAKGPAERAWLASDVRERWAMVLAFALELDDATLSAATHNTAGLVTRRAERAADELDRNASTLDAIFTFKALKTTGSHRSEPCERLLARWEQHRDEVPSKRLAAANRHIRHCSKCGLAVSHINGLAGMAAAFRHPTWDSAAAWARIKPQLDRVPAPIGRVKGRITSLYPLASRRVAGWIPGAAAAATVVALVGFVWLRHDPDDPSLVAINRTPVSVQEESASPLQQPAYLTEGTGTGANPALTLHLPNLLTPSALDDLLGSSLTGSRPQLVTPFALAATSSSKSLDPSSLRLALGVSQPTSTRTSRSTTTTTRTRPAATASVSVPALSLSTLPGVWTTSSSSTTIPTTTGSTTDPSTSSSSTVPTGSSSSSTTAPTTSSSTPSSPTSSSTTTSSSTSSSSTTSSSTTSSSTTSSSTTSSSTTSSSTTTPSTSSSSTTPTTSPTPPAPTTTIP
ncbi:MAG: hypothetical protein KAZ88_12655 [Acidimicrobiia bacterium]|nr:hypothetical protein [Acidimicrobiia bacterium]MBP8181824.1 hypothetical protein [Acidimicrobiia bacterium]